MRAGTARCVAASRVVERAWHFGVVGLSAQETNAGAAAIWVPVASGRADRRSGLAVRVEA